MASLFRCVTAAFVLAPLACASSDGEGSNASLPPVFAGNLPGQSVAPEPANPDTPEQPPVITGGDDTDDDEQGPPADTPLVPGDTPASGAGNGVAGSSGEAPPAAGGAGGTGALPPGPAAAGTGGAPEEPPPDPPAPSPRSDLPAAPRTGVPRPSGAAQNLDVIDWAGFTGAVSYTFDDSNSSQFSNYPALAALDVPFTFYLQTNKDETGANNQIWTQIRDDGHELGNHTRTHQMNGPNIGADTDQATTFIQNTFGVTVFSMAAPFGDAAYVEVARSRFLFNRGTNGGLVRPNDNTNQFSLPCFIPATGLNTAGFNAQVDMARAGRAWHIVLVHGFTGGNDGAFQPVAIGQFTGAVQYTKSLSDMWIGTLLDVGAYWLGQKLVTSAAPQTSGGTTTWTWTLPQHFPPDHFVRVTVDGGTLSQDGAPLTWDEHGYYEVSLDAGSLTLSP